MMLVTGGTGLLGNSVVRELLQRGERVRVLARAQRDGAPVRSELEGLDIELVTGDLHDPTVIQRAVDGCQAVVHCAAMIHIGYQYLDQARAVNLDGSRLIAQACRQSGSRLIYISTVDTLPAALSSTQPIDETGTGRPKTKCNYVVTKSEAEAQVETAVRAGLDAVILHPGFMLGPYDWKPSSGAMMLGLNKAPVVVAPRGTASVCDARDVAAAIAQSIGSGRRGEHYILAGENMGYPELFGRMLAVMGQSKRVIRMGPIIPAVARLADLWYRVTGAQEQLFNSAAIAMGQLHHAYDSSKAERELAYQRRPLEITLADAWSWVHEQFILAQANPTAKDA